MKLIPPLYKLGKRLKKPMTRLVNAMIRGSLVRFQINGQQMETNISNASNDQEMVLCPVCMQLQSTQAMKDIEVEIGKEKHALVICDSCYEKHIQSKQGQS
jgi:hypothetical protein